MNAAELRQRREVLGLSRMGLADALGISIRTVEGWESGRYSLLGQGRVLDLALRTLEREGVKEVTAERVS